MEDKIKPLLIDYKQLIPYLILGSVTFTILTCFHLKPLQNNYIKLDSQKMSLANATYEIFPHKTYNKKGAIKGLYTGLNTNNIVGIISGREEEINVSENATMHIKFIDKSTLSISLLTENEELFYKEYKGKFRRNGFFYFHKRLSSSMGFPLIAGGYYKYKSRLGLTKHGSLIMQTEESNIGRLLLFIKKGRTKHLVYHFRRLFFEMRV